MKVILICDVKKQGKKGEIIEVKDGYGTFLINNHQAVLLTNTGLNRLNDEKEKHKEEEEKKIKEAKKIAKEFETQKLVFKVKTGAMDKVFGSISTKQISEELKNKNYNIDKKQINLNIPISSLGVFDVEITLYKTVKGIIKVEVIK